MKALLVGCGSIGKRHLNNLNAMSGVKHIFVFTRVKDCLDDLRSRRKVSLVRSLNNVHADFAIIANETSRHIDTAITLAKRGIHLLIEKPVSHRLSDKLKKLKSIADKKEVKLGVGYNLRFMRAFKFVKDKISEGAIGDIYFAKIEAGQYLPSWRIGRDYRASYSASKKRGGGVALDLSHEVDYMRYLFGDPYAWKTVKVRTGELKIDSDDIFEGIYSYDGFVCNVHVDYLQTKKKRIIRIEGSKGSLSCDLVKKEIVINFGGRKKTFADKKLFDMDRTYVDEVSNFMRAIKRDRDPAITFEDGVKVLELIEA